MPVVFVEDLPNRWRDYIEQVVRSIIDAPVVFPACGRMCEGQDTSGAAIDLNCLNYVVREPVKSCFHPSEHAAPLDHDYRRFEQSSCVLKWRAQF
jgi:hypothetical protein